MEAWLLIKQLKFRHIEQLNQREGHIEVMALTVSLKPCSIQTLNIDFDFKGGF